MEVFTAGGLRTGFAVSRSTSTPSTTAEALRQLRDTPRCRAPYLDRSSSRERQALFVPAPMKTSTTASVRTATPRLGPKQSARLCQSEPNTTRGVTADDKERGFVSGLGTRSRPAVSADRKLNGQNAKLALLLDNVAPVRDRPEVRRRGPKTRLVGRRCGNREEWGSAHSPGTLRQISPLADPEEGRTGTFARAMW